MPCTNRVVSFDHSVSSPRSVWLEKRRQERFEKRKKLEPNLFIVPHVFTIANAWCGFYAIILAAQGHFEFAAYAILAGAFLDGLDGRIARFVGTDGPFGLQLDSLGDAISFCVAPALLCYFWQLEKLGIWGVFLAGVFVAAGLLRLARFNIMVEKKVPYFTGIPTTIAAAFLISIFLNRTYFELFPWFLPVLSLVVFMLSVLMLSSIKFPACKKMPTKKRLFYFVMVAGCAYLFFGITFAKLLLALFMIYFLSVFFV